LSNTDGARGVPLPAVKAILEGVKAMWYLIGFLGLVGIAALVAMVRVVVVQEATAVAFKFMGQFVYRAMSSTGHHFGGDGKICDGNGSKHFGRCWCIWKIGGWVFYLRPFVTVTRYEEQNSPDAFGHGIYVHLGDITPEPVVTAAETAESENIPLTVKFVMTMRIIDPGLWLFRAPKDVNSQVVKRLDAALRSWVRSGDQRHAQAARGNGVQLWSDLIALGCMPIFEKIEQDWGLRILENSIIVEDVGYELDYQKSLQAASKAKLEANASVEETAGRIIRSIATELGMTVDELNAKGPKFKNTPAYKEALAFARDMVKRDRAGDRGELSDIRVGNLDGSSILDQTVGMAIAGFAAGAKQFGKGGGRGGRQGNRGGGNQSQEPPRVKTRDELIREAEEFHAQYGVWPGIDPLHRGG